MFRADRSLVAHAQLNRDVHGAAKMRGMPRALKSGSRLIISIVFLGVVAWVADDRREFGLTQMITAQVPSLDQGPGGPILVITSTGNPFTKYVAEILRTEGFNEFSSADISTVTAATLAPFDVALLGDMPLTAAQVMTLTNWVNGGGNLIAMRPDKQLYGLLGVTDTLTPISDAYLLIDTSGPPGRGLVTETIQFHGTGDKVTLNGATSIATFYSSVANPTPNPAVTQRNVVNGRAAAFYYDLARSVVYTRQGNSAFSGDERDGVPPIRSDDLYYGNKVGDPRPDWVNLDKVQIPQADEQQRLLANLILQMTFSKKPLPRFWYFPRGGKAVVILSGDDHGNNGTAPRFDHYMALSAPGCNVANWECIRSSSYIFTSTPLTAASAAFYVSQGFEIGVHVDSKGPSGVGTCTDFTSASLANDYAAQINDWKAKYTPSIPAPATHRMHCVVWSDYSTQPTVELTNSIRLDSTFYYWPPFWMGAPNTRAGMFTGSGMPMRYADVSGNMIDVYQATTQMTDESGQDYPGTSNTLLNNSQSLDLMLDNAVGNTGYYGAFAVNMHNDAAASPEADNVIASAQAHQVPIVSSKQMLDWLDGRNGSSFGALVWSGPSSGTLTFTITAAARSNGMQAMLPANSSAGRLLSVTRNAVPVTTTPKIIKGTEYAFFSALAGAYQANYAPDLTPPVITNVNAAPTATTATITWNTDKLSNSHVDFGTNAAALQSGPTDSAVVTSHTITLTGLTPSTQYFYRVSSTDLANNTAAFPVPPGTLAFTTTAAPPPTTCMTDTTLADFGAGTGTNVYPGQSLNTTDGEVILTPQGLAEEFNGAALPQGWQGGPWTFAEGGPSTCNPPTVTTGCGTAQVANGALTVDGARAATTTAFSSGRSLEFVATFTGQGFQNVGFAKDFSSNSPWALFSTNAGGQLWARTSNGTVTNTALGSSYLNSPHRYRIDWSTTNAVFSIDGIALTSHTFAIGATTLQLIASDFITGGDAGDPIGKVKVEWMHMSPYATPGTFTSRVFDGGTAVTWSTLSWTAVVPTGTTTLALFVRTGNTATPDGTWSAFTPITNGGSINQTARFAQYQAQFTATDTSQTPVLKDVTICFTSSPPPQHTTITSVSCAPPSVPVNGSTTCTATVTDTNATPSTPTGTVSFTSNGTGSFTPAASCTLSGSGSSASCVVTYTPTAINTGTHTITASYGGDSTHATSNGSASVTVTARSTSTTVSCTPASVAVNQGTSCTATVTDTAAGTATTPTGTVTFTSNGTGSFTPAASCTLSGSGGSASCAVTYTPTTIGTGTHTITASYGGDSVHTGSSGTTSVTAGQRASSTAVSCSPSTVQIGTSTTCAATVSDASGSGAITPQGTVTFTTNGAGTFSSTTCTLDMTGTCSVTYTPSAVGTGTHTITAAYGGDAVHTGSSGSTNVTVTSAAAGEVEGGGKITVPGGTASFGFEVERKTAGGSIKGELQYRNRGRQMTVRATVIRQFNIVGNTATFSGDCTRKIDGGPWTACTFSVTAQDNADPGKNRDRFTITVNSDPPEGTAPIIAGDIEIEPGP